MRYESGKDLAISALIWGVTLVMAGVMVFSFISAPGMPVVYLSPAVVMGFLLWHYFGTYYELRDEYLYAKSGPFVERIRYGRITAIRKCRNFFSSMALASERIEIRTSANPILGLTYISPANRDEFFAELSRRCPHLARD